jgi:hypothetical protein
MISLSTFFFSRRNVPLERLALHNEVYKIALYLRQAQVHSLGVKALPSNPGDFNVPYGIFFQMDVPTRFKFFADQNMDGIFSQVHYNEVINFSNNMELKKICGIHQGNEDERCSDEQSSLVKIHITFKRPDPSALIRFTNVNNNELSSINPPAIIYIKSPTGIESSITIDSTGGISIDNDISEDEDDD